MNDPVQKCAACGSSRVVEGRLVAEEFGNSSEFNSPTFKFSELDEAKQTAFVILSHPRSGVLTRQQGIASACLDCGAVSASLFVDVMDAKKVIEKSGTDAAKARLAAPNP